MDRYLKENGYFYETLYIDVDGPGVSHEETKLDKSTPP